MTHAALQPHAGFQPLALPWDGAECFSAALKVNTLADTVKTRSRSGTQLRDHICSLRLSVSSIQHQYSWHAKGFENHLCHTCLLPCIVKFNCICSIDNLITELAQTTNNETNLDCWLFYVCAQSLHGSFDRNVV